MQLTEAFEISVSILHTWFTVSLNQVQLHKAFIILQVLVIGISVMTLLSQNPRQQSKLPFLGAKGLWIMCFQKPQAH